jgi:hypothetical protein
VGVGGASLQLANNAAAPRKAKSNVNNQEMERNRMGILSPQ